MLGGQIDGEFVDNETLLEIKSCNNYFFNWVCNNNRPLKHHRMQNHAYMLATEKRNKSLPRQRKGYLSPSQIGGCRQWALNQLRGEPQENHSDPWS